MVKGEEKIIRHAQKARKMGKIQSASEMANKSEKENFQIEKNRQEAKEREKRAAYKKEKSERHDSELNLALGAERARHKLSTYTRHVQEASR